MDIVVANFGVDSVSIFIGSGRNTFAHKKIYSMGTGSAPRTVAVGDFNNDNRLDIVVANFGTNSIGILYGDGFGDFPSRTMIETLPSRALYVVVDDFNNDRYFDIASVGYGTNRIDLLLGFGNGTFRTVTSLLTGYDSLPYAIAVGDLNNDGQLDIAVANYGTDNIGLFFGYGDGTFSSQMIHSTSAYSRPSSIAVGHLNNDTYLDIAVVTTKTNNLKIFLGYGNGSFPNSTSYSLRRNSYPLFVAIADFNNDGKSDITIAYTGTDKVVLLVGNGDGTFANPKEYSTGHQSSPYWIGVGDFNNDDQMDIVVANYQNNNIKVFNSRTNVTFGSETTFPTNKDSSAINILFISPGTRSDPVSLVCGDLNKDNLLDIATANQKIKSTAIPFGQSDKKFPTARYPSRISLCTMLIAVGDFNNDRRLDIVTANYDADTVSFLRGYGDGSFDLQSILSTGNTSSPTAVVASDLNNDGRLDILVANFGTNNIEIFFGHGNGEFSSQTTYFMGLDSKPICIVAADFNNDTHLDIAVANIAANDVRILLSDADGNFSSQHTYFTGNGSRPISIAVADFNNDGRIDITVANVQTSTVGVLLGHGNGTFQNQKTFSTGAYSFPTSLAVGDLDKDGNMDIVVANRETGEEHILVLLGDGHGNFSNHGKYITETGSVLCYVAIGHFNNDSQLDMAAANYGTQEIGIFLGYGDGTFSNQRNYPTTNNSRPISITKGDFNNDNLTDLVVANYGTQIVGIFLANMETNFVDNNTYSTGSAAFPSSIALADFTDDRQLDVVVGNDGTHDIDLLINDGKGHFSIQTVYVGDSGFRPTSIVIDDFNNDTRLDLAMANSAADTITLLYGENNGTFPNFKVFPTGIDSGPQSIAAGEFNNDNRTDMVVAYFNSGSVGLFLKIDTGALQSMQDLSTETGSKPHGLTVADFDNDGRLDIAVANNGKANIEFFFGFGNGSFSETVTVFVGKGIFPQWVGSSDFNNDRHLDVVVSDNASPTPVIVLLGDGNRSFRVVTTNGVDRAYMGAVGDFNGDGQLDTVLCQPWTDAIAVLLGYGNGTFIAPMIYPTGDESVPISITVGDFNNDSRLDIAVVNSNNRNIGVFLGHGDGTFANQTLYSTDPYGLPSSATTGDFDNDGQLDIAIAINGSNSLGVLFGLGNGTFWPLTIYRAGDGSLVQWIDAVDINNDGRLDIVVTNTDHSNLGIILGHTGRTFFNRITYPTGINSYPFSIGLGDFNNDSRIDVVVSNMLSDNMGILLGYASVDFVSTAATSIGEGSQPVSIAVGDFNHDTHLDVVVADSGTDNIIVLHGSGYGTFLSQEAYSTDDRSDPTWVAVNDFNHDQYLDVAVVNSGTNNIAIFLGSEDGTFSNATTYSTGKSSASVSLTVNHFNDDVHLDLAVANFGNNNVCLMFGYGNGSFASPQCYTSSYNSRPFAVASGDVNGDNLPDVIIANKGSSKIEILTKIC